VSFTNANKRFAADRLASFDPNRPGGSAQFSSSVKPVLTNASTYSSPTEALANNAYKYKDEEGVTRRLKVDSVDGVRDTYRIAKDGTQASKGTPKLAVNSSNPNRKAAANASLGKDVNLDLAAQKYQTGNDRNFQVHHLLEVTPNGAGFTTRTPESQQSIILELNRRGVFPSDDRRNQVYLRGNRMYNADGSYHLTGALDEHQGQVHSADSVAHVVQQVLMPSKEEFETMTDKQVADNIHMSALVGRLDVQKVKNVSTTAISKTEEELRVATAKAIAARIINAKVGQQTRSTLDMGYIQMN